MVSIVANKPRGNIRQAELMHRFGWDTNGGAIKCAFSISNKARRYRHSNRTYPQILLAMIMRLR